MQSPFLKNLKRLFVDVDKFVLAVTGAARDLK